MSIHPGMRFGKLTVIERETNGRRRWRCKCDCGNNCTPYSDNLIRGLSRSCGSCGKNTYRDCDDGKSVAVTTTNGVVFYVDKEDEQIIRQYKWHCCTSQTGIKTITASNRRSLHSVLIDTPPGMEVDHKDMNRLNNRRSNLRLVTHQQNQCNHPLQKNNTSGAIGVSFFKARRKFVARIKVRQKYIHLGYYITFEEAVQARNVGTECMFGEYGQYNKQVPEAPLWIREKVEAICKRFVNLSVCEAFRHLAMEG